jgi:hypothetical protein
MDVALMIGLGFVIVLGGLWALGRRSGETDFHGHPDWDEPPHPGAW